MASHGWPIDTAVTHGYRSIINFHSGSRRKAKRKAGFGHAIEFEFVRRFQFIFIEQFLLIQFQFSEPADAATTVAALPASAAKLVPHLRAIPKRRRRKRLLPASAAVSSTPAATAAFTTTSSAKAAGHSYGRPQFD